MTRYSKRLLDHFGHPRNAGILEDPDGAAWVDNPQCGDTTRLSIRVADGVITQVRWLTRGCACSIAASSVASEMATGLPLTQAAAITSAGIAAALGGLAAGKVHGSMLAAEALREAVADYLRRNP